MVEQFSLFNVKKDVKNKKRTHKEHPTFYKNDKIFLTIQEENTLKHIYRYQTLLKIYKNLFTLTYNKPLENLTYWAEDDSFFAEIKGTWNKDLKERVLLHIDLLRKIKNNDSSLIYTNKVSLQSTDTQNSLFSLNTLQQ